MNVPANERRCYITRPHASLTPLSIFFKGSKIVFPNENDGVVIPLTLKLHINLWGVIIWKLSLTHICLYGAWLYDYIPQETMVVITVKSLINYCKISNIRCTKFPNLNDSHLILQLAQSVNEDVVEAAPTGNAPTTSE